MKYDVAFTYEEKGAYAPKKDRPYVRRNNIAAIIKYHNRYLFLVWNEVDYGCSLVTGGIEDHEDLEAALVREVKEETGYYDIKRVVPIDCVNLSRFFVEHKDQNREAKYFPFLVELNSLNRHEMEAAEQKEHTCIWVEESDLGQMQMFENHKMMLKKAIGSIDSGS